MALGAVVLSLPVAMGSSLYLTWLHGLHAGHGVAIYAFVGALMMSFLTIGFVQMVDQPS